MTPERIDSASRRSMRAASVRGSGSIGHSPLQPVPSLPSPGHYDARMSSITRLVTGVCLIIALTACGADPTPSPELATIQGALQLTEIDGINYMGGNICEGSGGYTDISEGTAVTIRDQSEQIVGSGRLGGGFLDEGNPPCTMPFTIVGIPADRDFYSVSIGRRGEITYSLVDMEAADWRVKLTLGD